MPFHSLTVGLLLFCSSPSIAHPNPSPTMSFKRESRTSCQMCKICGNGREVVVGQGVERTRVGGAPLELRAMGIGETQLYGAILLSMLLDFLLLGARLADRSLMDRRRTRAEPNDGGYRRTAVVRVVKIRTIAVELKSRTC
jgi:hypothetical protein